MIEAVKVALRKNFNTDWSRIEALPGVKWAPLPPTSLQNCLPDGGCFARQGVAKFGDHSLSVIASGARTFVMHIYFRSSARAMGETNVLDALKQAGFASELARCPVKGTIGGTNWCRLQSASANPGVLSVQRRNHSALRHTALDLSSSPLSFLILGRVYSAHKSKQVNE